MLFAVEPFLHLLSSKSTLFDDAQSSPPSIVSNSSPADATIDRIFRVTPRNFTEHCPLHFCSTRTLFSGTTAALSAPFSTRISCPARSTSAYLDGKRGHRSLHHSAMAEEQQAGFFLSTSRSTRLFDSNIQMATRKYGSDPAIATIHAILASLADRLQKHQQQSITVPPFLPPSSDRDPPSSASTVRAGSPRPTSLATTAHVGPTRSASTHAHVGSHPATAATTVQVGSGKAIPFDTTQATSSRPPRSGSTSLGIIPSSDGSPPAPAAAQATDCTSDSPTPCACSGSSHPSVESNLRLHEPASRTSNQPPVESNIRVHEPTSFPGPASILPSVLAPSASRLRIHPLRSIFLSSPSRTRRPLLPVHPSRFHGLWLRPCLRLPQLAL